MLNQLEYLYIDEMGLTDPSLAIIAKFTRLKELDVSNNDFNVQSIQALATHRIEFKSK